MHKYIEQPMLQHNGKKIKRKKLKMWKCLNGSMAMVFLGLALSEVSECGCVKEQTYENVYVLIACVCVCVYMPYKPHTQSKRSRRNS